MRKAGLAAAVAILFMACDSGTNSLVAPDQNPSFSTVPLPTGIVNKATGGGQAEFEGNFNSFNSNGTMKLVFAFTAQQTAEEYLGGMAAKGQAEFKEMAKGYETIRHHGTVTCLRTFGPPSANIAKVGGYIELLDDSNPERPVFREFNFFAQDNGEPGMDDTISPLVLFTTAYQNGIPVSPCNRQPGAPLFLTPIKGNIQVSFGFLGPA